MLAGQSSRPFRRQCDNIEQIGDENILVRVSVYDQQVESGILIVRHVRRGDGGIPIGTLHGAVGSYEQYQTCLSHACH
jgi:hypothetical protein